MYNGTVRIGRVSKNNLKNLWLDIIQIRGKPTYARNSVSPKQKKPHQSIK